MEQVEVKPGLNSLRKFLKSSKIIGPVGEIYYYPGLGATHDYFEEIDIIAGFIPRRDLSQSHLNALLNQVYIPYRDLTAHKMICSVTYFYSFRNELGLGNLEIQEPIGSKIVKPTRFQFLDQETSRRIRKKNVSLGENASEPLTRLVRLRPYPNIELGKLIFDYESGLTDNKVATNPLLDTLKRQISYGQQLDIICGRMDKFPKIKYV